MLSISDTWKAHAGGGNSQVYVYMTLTVRTPSTWKQFFFKSGSQDLEDVPAIIQNVTPVSSETRLLSRKVSKQNMTITLLDEGTFRDIAKTYGMRNAKVELDLRYFEDNTSSAPYWSGRLKDYKVHQGSITLELRDPIQAFENEKFRGDFVNLHPLQAIRKVLNETGVKLSEIVTADFNPNTAGYGDISRLVVTSIKTFDHPGVDGQQTLARYGMGDKFSSSEGNNVLTLVNHLAVMCGGVVYVNESGELAFTQFNNAGASLRTLTPDDFDEIRQIETYADLVNRVEVEYGHLLGTKIYEIEDTASQARYADPISGDARVYPQSTELPFTGNGAFLMGDISSTRDSAIWLGGWQVSGFTGTRLSTLAAYQASGSAAPDPWAPTQDASSRVSVSYPAYYRIGKEIIRADRVELAHSDNFPLIPEHITWRDTDRQGLHTGNYTYPPNCIVLFDVTRGEFGTTARSHNASHQPSVQDVSPPDDEYFVVSYSSGSGGSFPLPYDLMTGNTSGALFIFTQTQSGASSSGTGDIVIKGVNGNLIPGETITDGTWSCTVVSVAQSSIALAPHSIDEPRGLIYDITATVAFAAAMIDRHPNGVPVLEFKTDLSHFDLQIGDMVDFDHDTAPFIWYGHDGLSTALKWEIIAKEVDVASDSVGIKWRVAFAYEASPPTKTLVKGPVNDRYQTAAFLPAFIRGSMDESTSRGFIASGADISIDTGRDIDFSGGNIGIGGRIITVDDSAIKGLPASSDNYIRFNEPTGSLEVLTRRLGASRPPVKAGSIELGVVKTDATTITEIDQTFANRAPIKGDLVVKKSLGFRQQSTVDSESFGGSNILPNGDIGTFSRGPSSPPDGWEVG